ncbi:NAD(P)-dependent iron-only hydrogenase diaphorase component iron-sulfur protein [Sporobacter termitidis DSM 10068]|uniref:NAD(P)-dependent iron-only hydrogenase diaphorase component iron-sulfur protein n=1 Tax=Sporobacter termitidis DSM 10068 TaxID=1123282 RepID=A0A1M5WTU7_9FIRM|nr:NAD(P)H-dependent oxidoreductase subunit E [Sporobacter termitidis]SHH90987.1 NAD(P)-dependent iron-only hydrogenase diaphorase component iron-sulfur protein [Sporobacter termitidis DSM 10068]
MKTTVNHVSGCTGTEEELLQRVRQLASGYKDKEGSLIQVLHMVQSVYGYLPLTVQQIVAEELGLPLSTVAGVVSFYSFFATTPRGRHTIRVCMGTACYVRGGVSIVESLEKQLGIQAGGTTADGVFTFEIARCIGSCGLAPAMTIDDTVYPEVKAADLPSILEPWYCGGK